MRPHRHLLVAAVLIGLGMVPQTGAAQGTGTSAARGPATQVEKDKEEEDRKLYAVRLQAQGNGVQESVVLVWPTPIPVAAGIKGLEILKGKLSRKELLVRTDPFRRAERFIRNGPAGGGIAKGQSFELFERSPIRVDVEIIRGINFRE